MTEVARVADQPDRRKLARFFYYRGTMQDKPLQFIANLTDRQYSLMMNGRGDRCLIELEAFQIDAALALVGMAEYTGRSFLVTIQEIPENYMELHGEAKQGAERKITRVGRRRSTD